MTNLREEALRIHRDNKGKLATVPKIAVTNSKDLSLVYSPGVAEPCKEIYKDELAIYEYTMKGNMIAVVSDGSAVLGLGDIGAKASLPVMEGKAVLIKSFAGVDAFPIVINTRDIDKILETVKLLEPNFGGINLEDIAAPSCFIIEERLKQEMNIPIFHDDQHGTAIVTLAGLINSLKLVEKSLSDIKIVVNGAGAAGIANTKLLHSIGVKNIILCDSKGIIYEGRPGMNEIKAKVATFTNRGMVKGDLRDALEGADVFIGVSAAGTLTQEMIKVMNDDPIIFAMANPDPEIMPEEAERAGARIVGTGRSDYPNQVNNVLAFPGILRGALDVQASQINEEMKIAAAYAIASLISKEELSPDYVIPSPFDPRVAPAVAFAIAQEAINTGVAKRCIDPLLVKEKTEQLSLIGNYAESSSLTT